MTRAELGLAAILLAGCRDNATEQDCEAMAAHLVELSFTETSDGVAPRQLDDARRAAHARIADTLASCPEAVPAALATCVLAADSLDKVAACEQSHR